MVNVICELAFLKLFSNISLNNHLNNSEFIEKYLFVCKLLKKNLIINVGTDKGFVNNLNSTKNNISVSDKNSIIDNLSLFILNLQKNNQNEIKEDFDIITAVRQMIEPIHKIGNCDILLIKADESFCQNVIKKYRVLCIGISDEGKIYFNINYAQVILESTTNLFNKFCNILTEDDLIINHAIVIDPHFFSNKLDYIKLKKILHNKPNMFLTIFFCENPKNRKPSDPQLTICSIEKKINEITPGLLDKIRLRHIPNSYHDRYLISGTRIFISGNTFSKINEESYLNSFSFYLHFDNLSENIKKLVKGINL